MAIDDGELSVLIEEVGARWQIERDDSALGKILRAESKPGYRLAARANGGQPVVVYARNVADLAEMLAAKDKEYADGIDL